MKRLITAGLTAVSLLFATPKAEARPLTPLQCDVVSLEIIEEAMETEVDSDIRIISGVYFDRDSELVGGQNVRFFQYVAYYENTVATVSVRFDCDNVSSSGVGAAYNPDYNIYYFWDIKTDREITEEEFMRRTIDVDQLQYGERLF